jgi:toluene monooxygenase system protein E
MSARRTYWHLESLGRKPTDYEIVSSKLLYYPRRGIEVLTPVAQRMQEDQAAIGLRCTDFDRFSDPRQTTYASYVAEQRDKEVFVDRTLASVDEADHDARLPASLIAVFDRVIGPLRYPMHGLQMLAAQAGAMAPSGKLVICCLLQASDETRRVQRLAYRLRQVQRAHPSCGKDSRQRWERDPSLQPLRELFERMLVLRGFGEAFSVLNLLVKPALDELFMLHLGHLAREAGDDALHGVFRSLYEDCLWQRQWSAALVSMLTAEDRDNARRMAAFAKPWRARVHNAVGAVTALLAELLPEQRAEIAQMSAHVEHSVEGYWAAVGLGPHAHESELA